MAENVQIEGKLLALHWNASESEATLNIDTSKPQLVTAEIEDAAGMTHRIEVSAFWDADFLVGKEVTTQSTDDGVVLEQVE